VCVNSSGGTSAARKQIILERLVAVLEEIKSNYPPIGLRYFEIGDSK
jgi:hypothetical protein